MRPCYSKYKNIHLKIKPKIDLKITYIGLKITLKGWKLQDTYILRLRTSRRLNIQVPSQIRNKESMPRQNVV